jgi:hypothetical protein
LLQLSALPPVRPLPTITDDPITALTAVMGITVFTGGLTTGIAEIAGDPSTDIVAAQGRCTTDTPTGAARC